jgi:hypothetical protein
MSDMKAIALSICGLVAVIAWFYGVVCSIFLWFSAKPGTLSLLDRSYLLFTPEKLTERGLRLRRNYIWAGLVFGVALVSAAVLKWRG